MYKLPDPWQQDMDLRETSKWGERGTKNRWLKK